MCKLYTHSVKLLNTTTHGRKTMLFEKLAAAITRHYKKIIAAWIVVLLLSVPLMFRVNDVVIYQETEAMPKEVEATTAGKIIENNFAVYNSTITIVIRSDDVTGQNIKDFTMNLETELANASKSGRIKYFESYMSIYTLYASTIESLSEKILAGIGEAQNQTNDISGMIYGGPKFYINMWPNTPISFDTFNNTWNLYNRAFLSQLSNETVSLQYGYHYIYWQNWNASFITNATLAINERVSLVVNMSLPALLNTSSLFDIQTKSFMMLVKQSFNIGNFNNESLIQNFSMNLITNTLPSQMGIPLTNELVNFIHELAALQNNSRERLEEFSRTIIEKNDIKKYPLQVPEFIKNFINVPKNDTMILLIYFNKSSGFAENGGGKPILKNVDEIRSIVENLKAKSGGGITTYVTGDAAISSDIEEQSNKDVERIDPATIIIVIVLVVLFFGSVVTPIVSLGMIGVGLAISQGALYIVGKYIANIHYSAVTFMFVALLGIGTDYCIFILARYREELRNGATNTDAVRTSVTWAGESIATSGATVMIGFGAMGLINFPLLKTMGMVLAIGVCTILLIALTLLPSVLLLLGDRVFWPKTDFTAWRKNKAKNNSDKSSKKKTGYFENSAKISMKYAKVIVAIALLVSIPTTMAVLTLNTSYDMIAGMPNVESKKGIDAMSEGFGKGNILKTQIVVQYSGDVLQNNTIKTEILDSIEYLCAELSNISNVKRIDGPTRPVGEPIQYTNLSGLQPIVQEMYADIMRRSVGRDNKTILLYLTLDEEPYADKSIKTIRDVRNKIIDIKTNDNNQNAIALKNSDIYVGGPTAGTYDISLLINDNFVMMAVVVFTGIFVILLFVLGSVLIPLRLILTIILSISWTLAAAMFVFLTFVGIPILWLMPLILFIVLMGLGMDYDIFLCTRIREEVTKGKSDEEAIATAVKQTGGIISICGVIMAGALGTMMFSTLGMLKQFGFALFFAILLDAMIVRIYLVPAIMVLMKKWNWWAPFGLQRVKR